jgi:hypothetical protein
MNMKDFRFAAIGLAVVLLIAGSAAAQKKTVKKPVAKKPPTAAAKIVPPLDVRAGREKVDAQLANVNRFVDVMGPIAQAIETLDESAKAKPLSKAAADKNTANKQKVIEAIRNLKAGLSVLESEFRTKAALQKYLPQIQGITDLASQAEDSAIAGRFVASKEPLRGVSKKLTDTMTAMPL